MEKLLFDFFDNNLDVFVCKKFGSLPVADGYIANIRRAIEDIHNSHIALGYALIAFAESHTFGCSYGGGYFDCRTEQFFDKCYMKFGLDKSTVSRHVNVVYRFGDGKDKLRSSFRDRTFSFLAELLPLSEQDIDYCLIHCVTVADVRKYKAELSDRNKSQKPVEKPVATSQQPSFDKKRFVSNDVFFANKVSPDKFGDDVDVSIYGRFFGMTIQYLCDKYLELERECTALKLRISSSDSSEDDEDCDCSEFTAEELFGEGTPLPLLGKGLVTA